MKIMQSDHINELAGALAKAQGVFEIPKKSRHAEIRLKDGRMIKYDYADLSDIRQATVKGLSENGLSISSRLDPETMFLWMMMMHSSGQWQMTGFELQKGLAAQQFGSALTYAKKYSYGNLTGIVSEDDDDANIGQYESERKARANKSHITPKITPKTGTAGPELPQPPKGITSEELKLKVKSQFLPYMKLFPNSDLSSEMMARYGATNISKLTDAEAWDFLKFIEEGFQKGVENGPTNFSATN